MRGLAFSLHPCGDGGMGSAAAKKRGLALIMHSFGGGAEIAALELAKQLAPNYSLTIYCTKNIPALSAAIPARVQCRMPKKPGLFAAVRHLWSMARQIQKKTIVLGSLELQSIFWAALFAPHKAVAWVHKDIAGYLQGRGRMYGWLYTALLGFALRRCRAIACVSDGTAASLAHIFPDLGPRCRTLWNPVDLTALRRRSLAPLPPNLAACFARPVILAVGRLAEEKNFGLLLEAHAELRQRGHDVHLCIAGEGPQRPFLEKTAATLQVTDSIFLPGFLDPCPLMREGAVFALSSDFEGFSLVIVEALALGLPVVSVNCPSGPAEVLENGRFGCLVPPGDARALAGALEKALRNPPTDAQREAGRRRAQAFDLDVTIRAWEKLLQEETKT